MGCDYCDSIKGVGPKTALRLIREHKNIETIIENLDRQKYTVPSDWVPNENSKDTDDEEADENAENGEKPLPAYVQARQLFYHHEVLEGKDVELKWTPPQVEELTTFLVDEMGFNPERVKSNIEKLEKAHKANVKPQSRMDSFFAVKANPVAAAKRKQKLAEEKANKKKKAPPKNAFGRKKR